MKQRLGIFALCLSAAIAPASLSQAQDEEDDRELTVRVGEQTSLSAAGVQSYSEGVRGVADVRLTRDQTRFIIVGEREGQTSLLLLMEDGGQVQYKITVIGDTVVGADPNAVGVRENIRLDLYFVRVEDSYSHAIGIGFPGSIGGPDSEIEASFEYERPVEDGVIQTVTNTTQLGLVTQAILPRIDIAQSNGWARIYRQAALITANGVEAKFSAGGEINVAVQSGIQGTLQQIEFGTTLSCLPRFDPESGRIELQVQAELADLSDDRGTGLPGLSTHSIDTRVNLELGESLVLAGFVAQSEVRNRRGLPGLSQIPILGALFGSHSRRYEASEGLMFIVPSVVDAVPLRERNRIEELMRHYEEFSGDVDEVEILDHPRPPRGPGPANPGPPEDDDD